MTKQCTCIPMNTRRTSDLTFDLRFLADMSARLPETADAELLMGLKDSRCFFINGVEYFVVEAICRHRKRGNDMFFLVKWEEFGPEHNSWEPLSSVEHLECFEEYRRMHLS